MGKASVARAESTPESMTLPCIQGSYPFSAGNKSFQHFSRTHKFFQDSKIHIPFHSQDLNFSLKLLVLCPIHFIFYYFSLQIFPRQEAFFQEFPVLENAAIKLQDFPGFSGPVRTLCLTDWGGLTFSPPQ